MRMAGAGFVVSSLAVALAPDLGWSWRRAWSRRVRRVPPTFMMLLVMTSPLPGRARVGGLAVFSIAASAGLGLAAGVAAWLIALGGFGGPRSGDRPWRVCSTRPWRSWC